MADRSETAFSAPAAPTVGGSISTYRMLTPTWVKYRDQILIAASAIKAASPRESNETEQLHSLYFYLTGCRFDSDEKHSKAHFIHTQT